MFFFWDKVLPISQYITVEVLTISDKVIGGAKMLRTLCMSSPSLEGVGRRTAAAKEKFDVLKTFFTLSMVKHGRATRGYQRYRKKVIYNASLKMITFY